MDISSMFPIEKFEIEGVTLFIVVRPSLFSTQSKELHLLGYKHYKY
jgi:hypothetical protein